MSKRGRTAGLLYALAGMVTWGLVPVYAHAIGRTMDPLLFAGLATLVGSVPLTAFLKSKGRHKEIWSARFAGPFLGIAVFGIGSTILLFEGTRRTSGINTGLLLQLEPFYSIALSALLLRESIGRAQIAATAVMVSGAAVISYNRTSGLNTGDLLIAIAPLFMQLSHVITKRIIHRVSDALVIPAARFLYSGAALTSIALWVRPDSLRELACGRNWLDIVLFGVFLRGLDGFLWYSAIQRISLSLASATIPLSVVVSFLGSICILKEPVEIRHLLGLCLILGGVGWLSAIHLRETRAQLTEEPL